MFATARKVFASSGARPALPLFHRAVEIDPGLAIAYAYIARCYGEMDQPDLAAEFARRAWRLRDHAAELDRFFIDLSLHRAGLRESRPDAADTRGLGPHLPWRSDTRTVCLPRTFTGPSASSSALWPNPARPSSSKPTQAIVHYNLAANLSYLGRYAEARQVLAAARKRGFDIDEFLMLRHDLAFLVGDGKK